MWDPVPRPGVEPWPLALGAWCPSHWTTREVPSSLFRMRAPLPKAYPAIGKTRKVINCLNLGRPWWFILMQQAVESKRGIGGKEKNKERKFGDCLYKSSLSALMWEREMVFLFSLRCSKHQRQKIDPLSPWLEAYRSRWVGAFFWVLLGSSLTPICHPTCEHRPVGRRRRDWGGLGGSLF